jgi:hypothetical protein
MNSPCDFPETCHDVGLTCENDRRLVTRMSKRPTLGSFLGVKSNQIPDPEAGKSGQFPVYPRPP